MNYNIFNKSELEYDYITCDLSREEMMKKYNINSLTSFKRIMSYFNIKKPTFNLQKKDLYQDFIVNNLSINDMCKKYNISSSQLKVYLDKYNIKKTQKAAAINRTKTFQNKYGVNAPICVEEIKDKIKKTNLEKYGCENVFQNEEIKQKIKDKMHEKYGVNNPMQYTDFISKQNKAAMETNMEKYGIPWFCLHEDCKNVSHSQNSKPNNLFENELNKRNINKFEREFTIENRSYDFKINDILIEIDPTITHNSTFGYKGKEPLSSDYHLQKSKLAQEHGFRCIHVFDWDDKNKIINIIMPKTKIPARKCEIKEIDNATDFLNTNHIQNSCKGQMIIIGLYYNNELVSVMSFGKPRYNKKYSYELLRLCNKFDTIVIGGSEKMFKYFVDTYKPKSIISYCDFSKFTGEVYEKLGFKLVRRNSPSRHWYNLKTKKHYTDAIIRQHGFSQIINNKLAAQDNLKTSDNAILMKSAGFVEVYDCGQLTFIWKSES